jgi:hypothetical protein
MTKEEKAARRMRADLAQDYHFSSEPLGHNPILSHFKTLCGDFVALKWAYAVEPSIDIHICEECLRIARLTRKLHT